MKKDLPKKNIPAAAKKGPAPAAGGDAAQSSDKKKGPVKKALKAAAPSKAAAKPAKKAAKAPAPKPVKAPSRGIPFICSECYEEFVLPATYARETVTCPECLHVGKRPAEDFLRTVTLHKSGERSAFVSAIFSTVLLLAVAFILAWVASPYSPLRGSDNLSKVMMILGVAILGSAGFLAWSVSKYEKNRWEIYF